MIATVIGLILAIMALWRKPFESTMKEDFRIHLDPGEDIDDFALWAFGPQFQVATTWKLAELWNERHGEKYLIDPSSRPEDDAPHMIALWRDSIK